ncbi:unnamed protein product [Caretta caretta]
MSLGMGGGVSQGSGGCWVAFNQVKPVCPAVSHPQGLSQAGAGPWLGAPLPMEPASAKRQMLKTFIGVHRDRSLWAGPTRQAVATCPGHVPQPLLYSWCGEVPWATKKRSLPCHSFGREPSARCCPGFSEMAPRRAVAGYTGPRPCAGMPEGLSSVQTEQRPVPPAWHRVGLGPISAQGCCVLGGRGTRGLSTI